MIFGARAPHSCEVTMSEPSDLHFEETVLVDNEKERIVRTDKFLPDGTWYGNDIHVTIKQGLDSPLEQAIFG
jgi:hypothetical protein